MLMPVLLAVAATSWLGQRSAQAEILYGVGGTGIYSVETTGTATSVFDLSTWSPGGAAWTGGGNAVAFDAFANQIIFAEAGGNRIGRYDLSLGTAAVVANLDSFSAITSVVSGGTVVDGMRSGAFFYNNDYYFTVENTNGSAMATSRLFRADLDALHTSFDTVTEISFGGGNPYLGDFGDMAVTDGGIVYGASAAGGGSVGGFWTLDIEDPSAGITVINSSALTYQLAFSTDRTTLYAHRTQTGDFGTIDPTTGAFTSLGTINGDATSLADLSGSFSAAPVPEPSGAMLCVLAASIFLKRRQRGGLMK